MAFKINNPFNNKDERSGLKFNISLSGNDERSNLNLERYMPQSWKDERSAFENKMKEIVTSVDKSVEEMIKRRGTSTYRETMEKRRRGQQPVFTNSKEKKYPYLMSVYNFEPIGGSGPELPWQCHPDPTDPRNQDVIACETWHRDNYNRVHSLAGTERGLLKDMEHDAKLASEIMEEALAMDYTEENYVKNLVGLVNRLRDEKGGFKLGGANLKNGHKNVAWQTKQQILKMIEDHEAAVAAQDSADNKRIMNWELQQSMRRLDDMRDEDGNIKFDI